MVLLDGIQAQHVFSQDGTAMKEVGQRDVDRFSCSDGKEEKTTQNAKLISRTIKQ